MATLYHQLQIKAAPAVIYQALTTEDGIGSCWLGWFDERAVKRALDIPRRSKVDILLCLGYPADPAQRPKVRRSLDDIRRYV